jgi:tetratricopeptide (TPR) repeat protein
MMVSGRRNNAASLRTAPFEVADLLGVDELRNFLSTHGVISQKEQETVVRGEYQMPKMFRVRPENASYTDAEIAEAVLTAHTTLSMREVTEGIQEAYTRIKRNEREQAIAHLTSLLNVYYAADPIFYELSLLYAQAGNYETAIEQLIPAIVLKPDQSTYWQLLANILQQLSHTVEANLAQVISYRFTT